MTTLKITFYKNIKSVLVLVDHHFLILGGKKGGGFNGWKGSFSQQIIIFFHKDIDNYEDECYDFQDELKSFLILNKYWECHEITEYLKIYYWSWSKHVKQIKWVFNGDAEYVVAFQVFIRSDKFSFGQTVFLNCLTECQTSCLGFSICLALYICSMVTILEFNFHNSILKNEKNYTFSFYMKHKTKQNLRFCHFEFRSIKRYDYIYWKTQWHSIFYSVLNYYLKKFYNS